MPQPIPTHYDEANDRWIFDLPHGVSRGALKGVADYVYRVNYDRWLAATGGSKERIGKALTALREGRYIGRLAGKGEHDFFKATEGTGKIISIGGA